MRREIELRGSARRTSARDSITGGKGNARLPCFIKRVLHIVVVVNSQLSLTVQV